MHNCVHTTLHIYVHIETDESEEPACSTSQDKPCGSVFETDADITEKTTSLLERLKCSIPLVWSIMSSIIGRKTKHNQCVF